ncbi:MAG: galactosamine-6-phosphate isomerase [Methylococcaceae bacterium]|nr:galactosamine-6-phosphate isomerase [Prolixibacteraceae bacterium]
MEIELCESYEALSLKASEVVLNELEKKRDLLLCTATGNSPTGTYRLLGEKFKLHPELFDQLHVVKLDEWGGIPHMHPGTCESYLQGHLIRPLEINQSRYTGFKSDAENPAMECQAIQDYLNRKGPIDLCILGLGINGHLAFNEPSDDLQAHCHIARLTSASMKHSMASEMQVKPTYGLTLGIADILQSKKILMLITGNEKRKIVDKFLSEKITTLLPASFLWLHPNVVCLIEKDTME